MSASETVVGISFEARSNVAEVAGASAQATSELNDAMRNAQQTTQGADPNWKQFTQDMLAQGMSAKEVSAQLIQWGVNAEQVTAYLKELGAATEADTQAASENAAAHANDSSGMEGVSVSAGNMRTAMRAMTAEMALATIASGQTLPQGLREAAKGLQEVASFAVMGEMVLPAYGAAIGAAVGALIALGTAADSVDPKVIELNKQLDSMSKKGDVTNALMEVTGWTQKQAEEALKAAKADGDYAAALDAFVRAGEKAGAIQQIFDGIASAGDRLGQVIHVDTDEMGKFLLAVAKVVPIFGVYAGGLEKLAQGGQSVEKAAGAFNAVGLAIEDFRKKTDDAAVATDKFDKKLTEMATANTAEITKLADQRQQAVVNEALAEAQAEAQAAQQIDTVWQNLTTQLDALADQRAKAIETEAQAEAKAQQSLTDEINKAQQQLNDSLAKAAQSLADKEADINRTLHDKLTDEAHKYQESEEQVSQQIAKSKQDLANKLVDIERQRQEQLAALDYNTAEQIGKAKTENERRDIEERAVFERSQINQRANDQRSSAEQTAAQQAKDLELRKKTLDEEYQYAVATSKREASERLADAQRSYAEEVAAARQRDAQTIADARLKNAEQIADLRQRLTTEEQALDQQGDKDRARANQEVANIQTKLATELTLKQEALKQSLNLMDIEYQHFVEVQNAELRALQLTLLQAGALTAAQFNQSYITAPGQRAPTTGVQKYAMGGMGRVPPGFEGDRYPILLSSGETYAVAPAGQSLASVVGGGTGGQNLHYAPQMSLQIALAGANGDEVIDTIKRRYREIEATAWDGWRQRMEQEAWR